MPNISANTLFHFTPRKWLLNILEKGFLPRYSSEFTPEMDNGYFNDIFKPKKISKDQNGNQIEEDVTDIRPRTLYIPMVCFCDIPLTSLPRHMDTYSSFGIGLTKAWGISKELNPVMYVNEKSDFFRSTAGRLGMLSMMYYMLEHPYGEIKSNLPGIHNNENFQKIVGVHSRQRELFTDLYKYIKTHLKPYQSKSAYRDRPAPYRYYDEKEWRHVPFLESGHNLPPLLEVEGSLTSTQLNDLNTRISEFPVTFNSTDIKYVLVREEQDIEYVVGGLHDIARRTGKYTTEEIHQITTKIITRTQIEDDF